VLFGILGRLVGAGADDRSANGHITNGCAT
jgi:hypothetical protein